MLIQKFKKTNEVEFSIVNISELEGASRIDSEYYDPVYIRVDNLIKRRSSIPISKLILNAEYGISIDMNTEDNGYKMLKMDDIIGVLADDTNCKYADIPEKMFTNYQLKKGDILFNRVNSEEFVGRTGIYLLEGEHTFASYLIRLHTKSEHSAYFITIFLNSSYGKKILRRVSRRSVNQANINAEELKSLVIPLPSETFQKKVMELVKKAQEQRNIAKEIYYKAEEIILKELGLLNWSPKSRQISVSGKKFEVEENVAIKKLSDVLNVERLDAEYWDPKYEEIEKKIRSYSNGAQPLPKNIIVSKTKIELNSEDIYNYIELADINENLGSVNHFEELMGVNLPSRARMKVSKDCILMSSVEGSVDKIALIDFSKERLVASTGFFIFKEDKLNKETILVLLKTLAKKYIKRQAQGTILTAIPFSSLNRIETPNLREEVQSKIAEQIKKSFQARRESINLLEVAKTSMDILVEKGESEAVSYINKN